MDEIKIKLIESKDEKGEGRSEKGRNEEIVEKLHEKTNDNRCEFC